MKTALAILVSAGSLGACATDPSTDPTSRCGDVQESTFAIHQVRLPTDWNEVVTMGVDYTGDGKIDNALGRAAVTMKLAAPAYDPSTFVTAHLQATPWKLRMARCQDDDTVAVRIGDEGGDEGEPAVGAYLNDLNVIADGGDAALPLGFIADGNGDQVDGGWLAGAKASLRFRDHGYVAGRQLEGRLALALPATAARDAILAPVLDYLNHDITGPAKDSLDDDHDGMISSAELLSGHQFVSLFTPDVTLAGAAPDALSFGFEFVADEE